MGVRSFVRRFGFVPPLLAAALLWAQPAFADGPVLGPVIGPGMSDPVLLYNTVTGKCADIPGGGPGTLGGGVFQYTCIGSNSDNQLWRLEVVGKASDGNALFRIRNAKDDLCMDVPNNGSVAAGTVMSEYTCAGPEDNQLFRMVARPGGLWLVNDKSNLCLDVGGTGNEARLSLYTCSDKDDHFWAPRNPADFGG